jgi:hypothetical protein
LNRTATVSGQFFMSEQFINYENASYSAWLHEDQHYLDDKEAGWTGFRILADKDEPIRRESNAYVKEIELAFSLNNKELAGKKEGLKQERIKEIQGDEQHAEIVNA